MKFYTDPWEYIVIDDFLPQEQFDYFCKQAEEFEPRNDGSFLDRYFLDYDPFKIDHLLEKFTNIKPHSNNFSKLVHFACMREPKMHPIHIDADFKIMTAVLYLSPNESMGTRLFDENKKFSKWIEWKPNRLFIFCSNDNTWHDFGSMGIRNTLNYFLVDNEVEILTEEFREAKIP